MQKYTFPADYQPKIEALLAEYKHTLEQPKAIADAVLKLSNHYQSATRITPWSTPEFVVAYAAYYFPLNYIRNLKLWDEVRDVGFPSDFSQVLDYGCGLGSALLSGLDSGAISKAVSLYGVDHMPQPLQLLKKYLLPDRELKTSLPAMFKNTLGVFSYSWNELPNEPNWFMSLDHILIAEPSTAVHARKLMEFRSRLIEKGFHIWAPCTHHMSCPLLTQSKTDWCHDRVHWEQPEWFQRIEKHLPIKNTTLTMSYMLASKVQPQSTYFGRIVGDELNEKGKTRWAFCRSDAREFLSHLARNGAPPEWKRGELFKTPIAYEQKALELRLLKKD